MKKINVASMILLGGMVLAGCAGDDGEGDAPVIEPPVSGDTQASDMDDDEAVEFCVSIYDAMSTMMETVMKKAESSYCDEEGFKAGMEMWDDDGDDDEIVDECKTAVKECEEDMEDDDDDDDGDAPDSKEMCEDDNSVIESCDAEVGDIAECLNAINQMTMDALNRRDVPACKELSSDYFEDEMDDSDDSDNDRDTPDACEDVLDECPELETMAVSMDAMSFN